MLKLSIRAAQIVIGAEDVLDQVLDLREEVDELDVRRQQQGTSIGRAQVILQIKNLKKNNQNMNYYNIKTWIAFQIFIIKFVS